MDDGLTMCVCAVDRSRMRRSRRNGVWKTNSSSWSLSCSGRTTSSGTGRMWNTRALRPSEPVWQGGCPPAWPAMLMPTTLSKVRCSGVVVWCPLGVKQCGLKLCLRTGKLTCELTNQLGLLLTCIMYVRVWVWVCTGLTRSISQLVPPTPPPMPKVPSISGSKRDKHNQDHQGIYLWLCFGWCAEWPWNVNRFITPKQCKKHVYNVVICNCMVVISKL